MKRFNDLAKEWMKDPKFRAEYEVAKREFEIVEELIKARATAKLTQAEIAERMGTTQSAVARLEGGRVKPSFSTLSKYAEATGKRLKVTFVDP